MAHTTKNALIIAPQWIGDAVMTEPLLRHLAARGERLTVAALPGIAPVYRLMSSVAEVIELPLPRRGLQLKARWHLARQWRGQFEVAYVCPNSLKSALLPWLAGIPKRVGYTGEMRLGLLTDRLPNPDQQARPPMVEWYAALSEISQTDADPLPLTGDVRHLPNPLAAPHTAPRTPMQPLRPVLQADAAMMGAARQALLAHLPSLPPLAQYSYVVFAPGAEYGPAKRWPAKHFAALADKLAHPVLLLGSNKDFDICQDITNAARPGHCVNLAGQTHLMQAFALIANAHRVVSNDSGLMHVAAAFGVPQVAVFGSSSPEHTPPLNDRARVVWLRVDPSYHPPLACSPCYARVCPLGHTRCLEDVSPERVYHLL